MTEAEWLACTDPRPMLEFLRREGAAGERKWRLFGVACCRLWWHRLANYEWPWVEAAERYADGLGDRDALSRAEVEVSDSALQFVDISGQHYWTPLELVIAVTSPDARAAAAAVAGLVGWDGYDPAVLAEVVGAAPAVLRDLFGNPFRPVHLAPACLTPTVLSLAQAAYDERIMPEGTLERARLAVLADALEEAGWTDAELLAHLRSPGPHVRGCFALDAVLGKG
jgi:hypothetical protein